MSRMKLVSFFVLQTVTVAAAEWQTRLPADPPLLLCQEPVALPGPATKMLGRKQHPVFPKTWVTKSMISVNLKSSFALH